MYISKRGELAVVLVVTLVVVLSGIVAWQLGDGITGAVIGFSEDKEVSEPVFGQANCGGATPCNCGDRITSSYTMTANLNSCSTASALTIGASNIILDCDNFDINGSRGSTYGINNSGGYSNVQIRNCNVTAVTNGIYFANKRTSNITIENSSVSIAPASSAYGIYLYNSTNSTVSNSTVVVTNAGSYAIYLDQSPQANITNNIVNTSVSTGWGVVLSDTSYYSYVYNNTVGTHHDSSYGIYSESHNNTIEGNKIITNGSTGSPAIYGGTSNLIVSNIIITKGGQAPGIESSSSNYTIEGNYINTSGDGSDGLSLNGGGMANRNWINTTGSTSEAIYNAAGILTIRNNVLRTFQSDVTSLGEGDIVINNTINNTDQSNKGISASTSNLIRNNTITSASIGISFPSSTSNSWAEDNEIRSLVTTGISIDSGASAHTLINNKIYAATAITDDSDASEVNYLIYNNSFGKIKWLDNGTGGFLRNLDLSAPVALGNNIVIKNHSVVVNLSAFGATDLIKFNANITFYQLNFSVVNHIYTSGNYTNTTAGFILRNGTNCLLNNCTLISHGLRKAIINVSYLGSFAVNGTSIASNTPPNTVSVVVNATSTFNGTFDDVSCYAKGTDTEHSLLQAEWIWYNGSVVIEAGNRTVLRGNVTLLDTLSHTKTKNGENWNCSVQFYDGYTSEGDANNDSIIIQGIDCADAVDKNITLTSSLTGCKAYGLNITLPGVTLDCNGFSINSSGGIHGININSTDVTVKKCNINNFNTGVYDGGFGNGQYSHNIIGWSNGTIGPNGPSTPDAAIYLLGTAKLVNNTIKHSNQTGVFISAAVDGSFSQDNTFDNNTYGVVLGGQVSESNFSTEIFTNNDYAIYANDSGGFSGQIDKNKFSNSYFLGNTWDVFISQGAVANVTIINSSTNKNKISTPLASRVFFKSYVDVYINRSDNAAIASANVTAHDSISQLDDSNITNANAFTRLVVTEYYRKGSQNFFVTPTTIAVSVNNFTRNSTIVNLLNRTHVIVNLTLNEVTCGSTVASSFVLGNNYDCDDSGFTISGSDVVIEGNGYNLTGKGTGTGITISGKEKVNVYSLKITNFTRGVYYELSNNSNLSSVTIINTTFGIIFNKSHNNSFYNGKIANITLADVFATNDGGTNNSFINSSINITNVSVEGTATVFLKWYVDVNVTNGGVGLANANVYGYFNDTGFLEDKAVTGVNGLGRLALSELKKNSSGIHYLTPHNITASFSYLGANITNSTSINLSKTNSTFMNLSVSLNCTSPAGTVSLSEDTTFCPGTYTVDTITPTAHGVELTCVETVIRSNPNSPSSLYQPGGSSGNHLSIKGCNFDANTGSTLTTIISMSTSNTNFSIINSSFVGGELVVSGYTDFRFINSTITGAKVGIDFGADSSTTGTINGSYFSNSVDIRANEGLIIANNTFEGTTGIEFAQLKDSKVINNTFSSQTTAIDCSMLDTGEARNNFVYFNRFLSNTVNLRGCTTDDHYNTTKSGFPVGNEWSDYCDKGKDSNSDGYADAANTGLTDWPYNKTVSTAIVDVSGGGEATATDYGPKKIDCPAENVFLGSGGGGGGSSSSAGGGSAAAASNTGGISTVPVKPVVSEYVDDTKTKITTVEGKTTVIVTLGNPTDEPLDLFANLGASEEDFVLIPAKTTRYKDPFRTGLVAPGEPASREVLEAQLNQEIITLQPGETKEVALEVDHPQLTLKNTIKIQIQGPDGAVWEKDVAIDKEIASLSAVNIHPEEDLLDVYLLIAPTDEGEEGLNTYFFELSIIDRGEVAFWRNVFNLFRNEKALFTDVYGPYLIPKGQGFIFDQQFKYDPAIYNGEKVIKGKIFKENELTVENEFDVVLE